MEIIRYQISIQLPFDKFKGTWLTHKIMYRSKDRAIKALKSNKGATCCLLTLRRNEYGYELIKSEDY